MTRRPPRARVFASEGAEAVFRGLQALPAELQYRVLEEIERGLAQEGRSPATLERRVHRALRSLNEAYAFLGASPSMKQYERARREHPEHEWPSALSVKRALGIEAWDDILRRAQLPVSPVAGDALEIELGPAFTSEEVGAALRECAHELGRVPSSNDYAAWAHRPDVRRRPGRRPLSQNSFARLFGSYPAALAAAGIISSGDEAVVTASGRLHSARYRVGKGEILEALSEVAERLRRSPRTSEYIRERELIYFETKEEGRSRALPSYGTIARHFPRWDDALVEAGLEPVSTREVRVTGPAWTGPRHSDEQILKALRAAYRVVSEPFTQRAYEAWRRRGIASDPQLAREMPGANAIGRRFGRWSLARETAVTDPSAG